MDVERLMAFHTHKVVPVPLMVPQKKVLAMRRVRNIPPIRQTLLHRAQCRMLVQLIFNIIGLKEVQHFAPQPATFQFIDFHLRFCFGCKFRQFFGYGNENSETAFLDSSYFRIFRLTISLSNIEADFMNILYKAPKKSLFLLFRKPRKNNVITQKLI